MRRLLPVLPILLLTACHTLPKAPVAPVPPRVNTPDLLTATHFRAPLAYLEAPLYDPDVTEWIPQHFLDEVARAIQSTIDAPYTDTRLAAALSTRLSEDDMRAVIEFYRSPTGAAVLAAEASFRERVNQPAPTGVNPTAPLTSATRLAEVLQTIFMSSADAVVNRLETYDCLAIMQIPGSHIGLNIAKRNRVGFMRSQVRRSLANLYAPLSADQQAAFLQFAQSPAGQRFYQARVDVMGGIGTEFGERVAEAIAPGLPGCVGSIRTSGG